MLKKAPFFIIFFVQVALYGCTEKFDKNKWSEYDYLGGSDRSSMADDLIQRRLLIGLSNKQMLKLLGPSEKDNAETQYTLEENYEFLGIDPVSGKYLIIKFNKDSIITSAEIKEWHKH